MGPWSPTVHAVLRGLEAAGFEGAPRVVGVEGGDEVLTFIEGEVPSDADWQPGRALHLPAFARSEAALIGAARLLARAHEALDGFDPPEPGYRLHPHARRDGEVVAHGDVGPWNTVYREGVPVGFIDWDSAQPMEPLVELGFAAWGFVPLMPPSGLRDAGFDEGVDIARRLRAFVDAYGLDNRGAVIPALQRARLISSERVRYWPIGPAEAAASLGHVADDLRWLATVEPVLTTALR